MSGYRIRYETVAVAGVADLFIRSLLDKQQFADPQGDAHRLGITSATWPMFGQLWPSGAHLAARLALRPVLTGEHILELGCGLGLASLVGHRRGADVTASDCHPLAGAFLLENLRLNGLLPMKYRHGQWGAIPVADAGAAAAPMAPAVNPAVAPEMVAETPLSGQFELIIGSDLLYERDAQGDLAHYIQLHATAVAEVWIVDPDRGNRPAFNRQMAVLGFDLQEHKLTAASGEGGAGLLGYKGRLLQYLRH